MEVKAYNRKQTVKKTVEVKEDVPYIGIHLTEAEAATLFEWMTRKVNPFAQAFNEDVALRVRHLLGVELEKL